MQFFRDRSSSLTTVVLVLVISLLLQGEISFSTTFGRLGRLINLPGMETGPLPDIWFAVRVIAMVTVLALWLVNRKRQLFSAIMVLNSMLTLGLLLTRRAKLLIMLQSSISLVTITAIAGRAISIPTAGARGH